MLRFAALFCVVVATANSTSAQHVLEISDDRILAEIAETGTLRLAMRSDVAPFSSREEGSSEHVGYSVDLCRWISKRLEAALERPVKIEAVEVTAEDRFRKLRDGEAHLLCEATTITLARPIEEEVEFSLMTFVTGGTFLYREGADETLEVGDADRIGAIKGTTGAATLEDASTGGSDETEPGVRFSDYDEAIAALQSGKIDILMGDRLVLTALVEDTPGLRDTFKVSNRYLSYEPYALAMPADARLFRYYVNRALSDFYRTGEVGELVLRHFSIHDIPRDLSNMYRILALP